MKHAAEARAARALIVERMSIVCCGSLTIDANEGRRVEDVAQVFLIDRVEMSR